jgi:hypothetical protein
MQKLEVRITGISKGFQLTTFKAFREYLLLKLTMHMGFVRDKVALERLFSSVSHRSSNDACSYISIQPSEAGKTEFKAVDRLHHQNRSFSFHLVVCLTTGPKPLPKRALHIVRSRASSFR